MCSSLRKQQFVTSLFMLFTLFIFVLRVQHCASTKHHQAFFYVCTGRRSWRFGSAPRRRDQWDWLLRLLTRLWAVTQSIVFVDLRPSLEQTVSVQEFKSGINWTN
jgi:hypothetical protein